jgi:hypothetical protein
VHYHLQINGVFTYGFNMIVYIAKSSVNSAYFTVVDVIDDLLMLIGFSPGRKGN